MHMNALSWEKDLRLTCSSTTTASSLSAFVALYTTFPDFLEPVLHEVRMRESFANQGLPSSLDPYL